MNIRHLQLCGWAFALAFAMRVHAQDSVLTLAGQPQMPGATNGLGTNALFNAPLWHCVGQPRESLGE